MDFSGNSWLKNLHRNSLVVEKRQKKVSIGSEILIATELYLLYTQPITQFFHQRQGQSGQATQSNDNNNSNDSDEIHFIGTY